jgi:hypothetical protein
MASSSAASRVCLAAALASRKVLAMSCGMVAIWLIRTERSASSVERSSSACWESVVSVSACATVNARPARLLTPSACVQPNRSDSCGHEDR